MKISQLNDDNTLFTVDEVYPQEIISQLNNLPIDACPWEPLGDSKYTQIDTPRRMLISDGSDLLTQIDQHIKQYIPLVQQITNKKVSWANTRVWADYPGYTISRHVDNPGVYISLQVYLNDGPENLGTHFSDSEDGPIKHSIPFKSNTGYLMVNSPCNWHEMIMSVPQNFIRLSSYSWFTV